MKPSPAFIADTIRTFSPYYGRQISEDEAIEIINNFSRFVEYIGRLSRKSGENCETQIATANK